MAQRKLCDLCGQRPATCHTIIVINGVRMEADLCEFCLAEQASLNVAPVYSAFRSPELECPVCHTRLSDIAGSEYVGCSECYNVFRGQILNNIQSMHGTRKHRGKKPRTAPSNKTVNLSDRESMIEQYRLAVDEGRDDDAEELYGFITEDDENGK